MSRDIRSFFKVTTQKKKKTPVVVISDDDDNIIEESPAVKHKKQKTPKDDKKQKGTTSSKETLKPVKAADLFGNAPVKQSKVVENISDANKKSRENKKATVVLSDDDDLIKESLAVKHEKQKTSKDDKKQKGSTLSKETLKLVEAVDLFGNSPVKQSKVVENISDTNKKSRENKFNQTLKELDDEWDLDLNELDKTVEELSEHPQTPKDRASKKRKVEDLNDSSMLNDQEKFERRQSNYMRYINRGDPPNKGHKEMPEGNPGCLKGLCFLKTGVLDSLDSEGLNELVVKYGGRTVKTVSRKINYLIVGEEPGPSKMEKARSFGIPEILEDDLLDMILTKSGKPAKYKIGGQNNNIQENLSDLEAPSKKRKVSVENSPVKGKTEKAKQVTPKKVKQEEKPKIKTPSKEKNTSPVRSSPRKSNKSQVDIKEDPKTPLRPPQVPKIETITSQDASKRIEQTAGTSKIPEIPTRNKTWTEKYKPTTIKEIVGQQDANSNMNKLIHWLKYWTKYHGFGRKVTIPRPSPWAKSDDGAYYKAALLSGSPGVGKTTTATLVAKELGYDIVEFNASDTRSKKLLQEQVATLLSTKSVASFVKDGKAPTSKHILLMDEVDGMSGNEDRGGVQELIALIKNTNIPIICICNDRQHPKIRSLVNYCFDLRFNKMKPEMIRGKMMTVCFKEGLTVKPDALLQMIVSTGCDVRQTLNNLAMWSASGKNLSNELLQKESSAAQKDTILGPWEVVRKVFSADEQKNMTLDQKTKLFFYDYNIGPLFIAENYIQVTPNGKDPLKCAALAADAISMSDVIEKKIRSGNNWSLMEAQSYYASVLPGHYMRGKFKGQINFPSWLGKNSKGGKLQRFASELQGHMRLSASTSKEAVNLDYIYSLRDNIVNPLIKSGTAGAPDSVQVMKDYNLLREDLDSILELSQWPHRRDPMSRVESKAKAAFTRAYNRDGVKLPYAIDAVSKKKTTAKKDDEYGDQEDDNAESEEDKDKIENDGMIKELKATAAKGKKETSKASTSKKPAVKGKAKKAK